MPATIQKRRVRTRPRPKLQRRIDAGPLVCAFSMQKGGTGKSTTTWNVAVEAASRGLRVLIIDLDDQGNITLTAAPPLGADALTVADALMNRGRLPLADVIVPGVRENLFVAPANATLATANQDLVIAGAGRELRLDEAIVELTATGRYATGTDEAFDLILIDCGPNLSLLTLNAAAAADKMLIVSEASQYAAAGVAELLSTIEVVRKYYNQKLEVVGVLLNKVTNTNADQYWVRETRNSELLSDQGVRVLPGEIKHHTWIKSAQEASLSLRELNTEEADLVAERFTDCLYLIMEGR